MDKVIYNNHLSMIIAKVDDQRIIIGFCDQKPLNNFFHIRCAATAISDGIEWMREKFAELEKQPHYWRYVE